MTTYLYARVSTDEQADTGASLTAQASTLTAAATARGWDDARVITEDGGASGRDLRRRPVLTAALDDLDRRGGVLVVTTLDRLTRSVVDLGTIITRASARGWHLVILDSEGVDTTTPHGEAFALMAGIVAQLERRLIAQRTRAAMAQRRREGVHLGRAPILPTEVVARIVTARAAGRTLRGIAEDLTADAVPTAMGGAWHASTVRAVLAGTTAARLRVAA